MADEKIKYYGVEVIYLPHVFSLYCVFFRMGSAAVHMVCVALGVIGLIGVIVCCALPRWKVSSFTGANIVTSQVIIKLEAQAIISTWIN